MKSCIFKYFFYLKYKLSLPGLLVNLINSAAVVFRVKIIEVVVLVSEQKIIIN